MKKYFTLIILLLVRSKILFADDGYMNYWNRNQKCKGYDFQNKNITDINITNEEKYIIESGRKYYITDHLDGCLGLKIKNNNAIILLPGNCQFLFGDPCIELNTGDYKLFQYERSKNGCVKLDVFMEYNDSDVE